jgi:hypothetical protein
VRNRLWLIGEHGFKLLDQRWDVSLDGIPHDLHIKHMVAMDQNVAKIDYVIPAIYLLGCLGRDSVKLIQSLSKYHQFPFHGRTQESVGLEIRQGSIGDKMADCLRSIQHIVKKLPRITLHRSTSEIY